MGGDLNSGTRSRFDTLFTSRRHFRGDCRLLRTAVRRGWLDAAGPEVRSALVERFARACDERHADPGAPGYARGVLAEAWVWLAMEKSNREPDRLAGGGR